MDEKLFEICPEIDVESLMSRIREGVSQRAADVLSLPSLQDLAPGTAEPPQLAMEIVRGTGFAGRVNEIPIRARGAKGRIELELKKFLKWLVHWNTKSQAEFNHSVMRSLELIVEDLHKAKTNFATVEEGLRNLSVRSFEFQERMSRELGQVRQDMRGVVEATETRLVANSAKEVWSLMEQISRCATVLEEREKQWTILESQLKQIIEESLTETMRREATVAERSLEMNDRLYYDLEELRIRILRIERLARKNRSEIAYQHTHGDSNGRQQLTVQDHRPHAAKNARTATSATDRDTTGQLFDYFLFEHRLRGSVAEIKRRQAGYLELFENRHNVVDLGCGRGEFVELLTEKRVNVTGIDSSEDMVDFCCDRGLKVLQCDLFEYLEGLQDGELDGVLLSQVVEHFSPQQILDLLQLCAKKLELNGVIVIETMNISCPIALCNFYLDPSHVRPVPAEMLRFMVEHLSYQVKCLRFSSPLPNRNLGDVLDLPHGLSQESSAYQDYAVVAVRV
jgi:2-polyprenyl-3-methyl-5-hydroxy-6-metoxy-1,4-benzoquinol methylase